MPHIVWLQERLTDGSLLASGPLPGAGQVGAADHGGTRPRDAGRHHPGRSVRRAPTDREYDDHAVGPDLRRVQRTIEYAGPDARWLTSRRRSASGRLADRSFFRPIAIGPGSGWPIGRQGSEWRKVVGGGHCAYQSFHHFSDSSFLAAPRRASFKLSQCGASGRARSYSETASPHAPRRAAISPSDLSGSAQLGPV